MASENIFENYSEEIITETAQSKNVQNVNGIVAETEDMTALLNNNTEEEEVENNETQEIENDMNTENGKTQDTTATPAQTKLIKLPLARVRNIMKLDPDLNIASNEAVFAVTRSTELFIQSLAREAYLHTRQSKKKTLQKRDVDSAISGVDSLMFLEGAMNF